MSASPTSCRSSSYSDTPSPSGPARNFTAPEARISRTSSAAVGGSPSTDCTFARSVAADWTFDAQVGSSFQACTLTVRPGAVGAVDLSNASSLLPVRQPPKVQGAFVIIADVQVRLPLASALVMPLGALRTYPDGTTNFRTPLSVPGP